jgi:addiction module HigA family antidote
MTSRPRNGMRPVHPGEILREDYLVPLDMSANALARELRVPANRVTGVLNGDRSVTADTALRLARHLGTSPEFWMNLQQAFDLRTAEIEHGKEIERDVLPDAVGFARKAIGNDLREARKRAGLTHAELARKLRKSRAMVAAAESGQTSVGESYVRAVLKACGLPADWKS